MVIALLFLQWFDTDGWLAWQNPACKISDFTDQQKFFSGTYGVGEPKGNPLIQIHLETEVIM